ncbi:MAG: PhnD/SsuA/transferrin family substrate-binding protein, partial [Angelakisella sp.]
MKKLICALLAATLSISMMAGCSNDKAPAAPAPGTPSSEAAQPAGNQKIDKLNVYFVPSREPAEIVTATEPLKAMLTTELAKEGYDIGEVVITVGTNYEAVGEALSAGTADVGLIPGGTYVLYDDGCDVILTATRDGLSKDSDNAKDWNDGKPTEKLTTQAVSYRALIIAGPSEKGKALTEKVN